MTARLFLPARPPGWEAPEHAPDWQRWLMGDSGWHLPETHPALQGDDAWVLAHPAYFAADISCLRLTGIQDQPLEQATQQVLAALLQETLGEALDTLHPLPTVFALRLKQPDTTRFRPLGEVFGEDLQHCLPTGELALRWAGWINALQMASQQQPMADAGINGIWFSRPAPPPATLPRPKSISGDGPARRWAARLHCPWQPAFAAGRSHWHWQAGLESRWPPAGRLARWLGQSVHVHAGLNHYWPHRQRGR